MTVALAPMEGVVDWVVRDLYTAIGGIDWCVTEFIRVTDRMVPAAEFQKYCPELLTGSRTRAGTPVLVQLLGGQPGPMAENAARACELGAYGIDLNFGCPAKTVNRHDGGASLLKNPHRVYDVVKAVRAAVPRDKTVSAKIRLGFSDKSQFLEIAQAAAEAESSWLAVHARTRDEGYRPPAHWEYIARIRTEVKIPVIANGEIWTPEDFRICQDITGCTSFMLGRGLMARPFLAHEVKQHRGDYYSWMAVLPHLSKFFFMSRDFRSPHYAVCRIKQWTRSLARTYPEAERFFVIIKRFEEFSDVEAVLSAELSAAFCETAPKSLSSVHFLAETPPTNLASDQ